MSGFIKINGVEVAVPVSGPDKLLGRTTAGAGAHEEITISGLPAETTPVAGDLLLIEVGGELRKLDVDNLPGGGGGTVTSASVVSANGLAGTVANATTTPAITLSTTVTGVLKGNGTAISAAANSDLPAMSATVGGAVPTPPNNTTTFLRGDGTFADPAVLSINAQTGTTYTLVLGDGGKLVTLSNASAITMTVPPNSSVAFPVGTQIDLAQIGAGQVTVAQGSGVTVSATPGLKLRARYAGATLIKIGTDAWLLFGDLAS